jgi:prepilin-type N-terminal cleavage/methylation domain-containing protein
MRKGVTLIEVLVASLILVIGIGGIMISLPKYSSLVYSNNFTREAYLILQSNLEFYLNKDGKLIEEDLADTTEDGDNEKRVVNGTFKSTSYGNIPYKLVISAERKTMDMTPADLSNNKSIIPSYLDLNAVITWSYSGNDEIVSLRSFYGYSDLTTITGSWP